MDALLPAFLAALLAEWGDKSWWLALALGTVFRRTYLVIAGIVMAAIASALISAAFGQYIAPQLSFQAATLLLALALIIAGFGGLWRVKPVELTRWQRFGVLPGSFLSFFMCEFGDKTQFLNFALAARTESFWLVAVGGASGVICVSITALFFGDMLLKWPGFIIFRRICAAIFLVTGTGTLLHSLRLI